MELIAKVFNFIVTHWDTLISLVTAITTVCVMVKNIIKNKQWKKLIVVVKDAMAIAEAMTNFKGEEKKAYVLTKANQFAIDNNIKFDQAKTSELIEDLVRLTKMVNARDKDKITTA